MSDVPDDLRYTTEHEWVAVTDSGTARVGVTDYAQSQLGDIVYVTLPAVGTELQAGTPCGELESTKSVSDIYAPVDGTVIAVNGDLDGSPELVNTEPYGAGWMIEIELTDPAAVDGLLDAAAYQDTIAD